MGARGEEEKGRKVPIHTKLLNLEVITRS